MKVNALYRTTKESEEYTDIVGMEKMHIAEKSVIYGDINASQTIAVEGRVEGNIITEGIVHLNGMSNVRGDIHSQTVHVQSGYIIGDVKATTKVVINGNGCVKGSVCAPLIIVHGVIEGDLVGDTAIVAKGATVKGSIKVDIVERVSK